MDQLPLQRMAFTLYRMSIKINKMLTVQQTRKLAKNTTGPKLIIDTEKKHKFYNITKAKHAL